MKRNTISTLAVKFWASIETPPSNNRESFRQSVIDTILKVLRLEDVTIEYIGYKPDKSQNRQSAALAVYEDCVFVSMNMNSPTLEPVSEKQDKIIDDLIRVFEDKTHKHLEVDSKIDNREDNQRVIEMTSDWKYYLKQG